MCISKEEYVSKSVQCVPISWSCKNQTAVSHSSTDAEVISLDPSFRTDGNPALRSWDAVIDALEPLTRGDLQQSPWQSKTKGQVGHNGLFGDFDFATPVAHISSMRASLYVFEDNEALIKMIIEGQSPRMTHVSRTHRVGLDWLFDRITLETVVHMKYVNTVQQIADVLTKGSFSQERRTHFTHFCLLTHQTHSSSLFAVFASCLDRNLSKRQGATPNEQASAKPKRTRGLCSTQGSDRTSSREKGWSQRRLLMWDSLRKPSANDCMWAVFHVSEKMQRIILNHQGSRTYSQLRWENMWETQWDRLQ